MATPVDKMEMELDRLSSLRGHVMDQILSRLPIRDAVRTSVISRNWRYKWASIPHLVFDEQCVSVSSQDQSLLQNKLVKIIDSIIILHDGPIDKFKLSHKKFSACSDINRWVLRLSRSSIKELILEIWEGEPCVAPSCLFNCEHLVHLELFKCVLKPPESFKGFGNLKTLDLQCVTLTQDAFEILISRCPLLEGLTLINFVGFTSLNIDSPRLQVLYVGGSFNDIKFENTSHLAVVTIDLQTNASNNENLAHCTSIKPFNFFEKLPQIRRLGLRHYSLQYLALKNIPGVLTIDNVHLSYLSLHIDLNDVPEILAFFYLLKSCPNLRELEILARSEKQTDVSINIWDDMHLSSSFSGLQRVKITGLSGVNSELDLISFLLLASPVLEKMIIFTSRGCEHYEFMEKLLKCKRKSEQAEIIYSRHKSLSE